MPRPKKQKNNPEPKEESELYNLLWDLHNHIDKADELVQYLEGVPEGSNSRDFCKAYTIFLFQEYIEEDPRELMLAACNLLKGFNNKNLDDRMQAYRKYIGGYNSLIKESWSISTYSTNYRNLLKNIIYDLESKLEREMEQNNGKLGRIDDVPKKLKLPTPRSIPEVNEKKNETEDSSNDTRGILGSQKQGSGNLNPPVDPDTDKDKKKKLKEKNISVVFLVISIIATVCIAVPLFRIASSIEQNNFNEQAKTDTKNDAPKIEMFCVFNKSISLSPGQSEEIKVGLYPNDADKNDLNCISKNHDIATVNDLIVTAKDWQEGHDTTTVTVGCENAENVDVSIVVESPKPTDTPQQNTVIENGINPNDGSGEYKKIPQEE